MGQYRRYLPKNTQDALATVFTFCGINAIGFFELLYVLPRNAESTPGYSNFLYNVHLAIGWYIYINALGAYWKVITTDSTIHITGLILPTFTREGWRFCPYCECNAPPRSYHCYQCKVCVLKRDHHCVFTGNCIGYYNHRYYMQLVFFCSFAAFYATMLNFDIILTVLSIDGPAGILKIIFPFLVWVIGYLTFEDMLISAMVLFCTAVMCTTAALFFYHARNLYFGQITTERTYKKFTYNLGLKRNLQSVFGYRWRYAWLSPWIPSQLPGNGLEFSVPGQIEHTKDI